MSEKADIKFFKRLKKQIAQTCREQYPEHPVNIDVWKGKEIEAFQTHLESRVHGRISEKWFYTHLKSGNAHLPRIDILNMLSNYCGYKDWHDFKRNNLNVIYKSWAINYSWLLVLILPIVWWAFASRGYVYEFEIVDAISLQPVEEGLKVIWLKPEESPQHLFDEDNSFSIETNHSKVKLCLSAPYYQQDTIIRHLRYNKVKEIIALQPNDYAMMIHYFSQSKVEDWKKRRVKLDEAFADDATIFQVDENGKGMAMYNKVEFIDRLSFPYSKLKNIEILETRLYKDKIAFMRFKIEDNEE